MRHEMSVARARTFADMAIYLGANNTTISNMGSLGYSHVATPSVILDRTHHYNYPCSNSEAAKFCSSCKATYVHHNRKEGIGSSRTRPEI